MESLAEGDLPMSSTTVLMEFETSTMVDILTSQSTVIVSLLFLHPKQSKPEESGVGTIGQRVFSNKDLSSVEIDE